MHSAVPLGPLLWINWAPIPHLPGIPGHCAGGPPVRRVATSEAQTKERPAAGAKGPGREGPAGRQAGKPCKGPSPEATFPSGPAAQGWPLCFCQENSDFQVGGLCPVTTRNQGQQKPSAPMEFSQLPWSLASPQSKNLNLGEPFVIVHSHSNICPHLCDSKFYILFLVAAQGAPCSLHSTHV